MQQIFKKIFALLISVVFLTNVNAASNCSNEEKAQLNSLALNIKTDYEEAKIALDSDLYTPPDSMIGTPEAETFVMYEEFLRVNIINMNEKLYLEISNNQNKDVITITNSDVKDGVASFDWKDRTKVVTFTIKIYTSDKTGCPGEHLRTTYITLPRLNGYYYTNFCVDNPEFKLCEKYVTYSEVSQANFDSRLNEYLASKETEEEKDKEDSFFNKHKIELIIGGCLLLAVAGATITVVLKKNRRKRI